MTGSPGERGSRPLLGVAMMLLAVLSFTILDSTAKYLSSSLPVAQLVWGRFFFTLLLTLAFLPWLGLRGLCRTRRPLQQVLRGATLLGATGALFLAVKYLPLAETYAITVVSPLLVALAAGPLLGERVDWRRWLAILGGFAGVLVVIRPGSGAFSWHVVFPLAMAAFWAANQLITRALGTSDRPAVTLFYTALIGTLGASIFAAAAWRPPDLLGWLGMAWMGLIGFLSQFAVIYALTLAPASLLSPFTYTQIVWAALIGYVVFADVPDDFTLIGAAIVTLSGVALVAVGNRTRQA
jgi:drug/metabolite transporter (DMT)-like permease